MASCAPSPTSARTAGPCCSSPTRWADCAAPSRVPTTPGATTPRRARSNPCATPRACRRRRWVILLLLRWVCESTASRRIAASCSSTVRTPRSPWPPRWARSARSYWTRGRWRRCSRSGGGHMTSRAIGSSSWKIRRRRTTRVSCTATRSATCPRRPSPRTPATGTPCACRATEVSCRFLENRRRFRSLSTRPFSCLYSRRSNST
mmetsp:Transcript_13576/g.54424  ORF Transcript_13576/g.54424 Transcript_13576/m.54424 type:complete len:205 (+) Transcript_13576:315-929(+)